jgi:hypothetical protein
MSDVNLQIAKAISEIAKQNSNIYTALLASKNKSVLESILPTIYAATALILGFGIQYFFFKKTEKKEFKKEVGKLYGDFALFSREYETQFTNLAYKVLQFDLNSELTQAYLRKLTKDGPNQALSDKIARLQQEYQLIRKNYEQDVSLFMDKKSKAMKSLHEIQFLTNTFKFDDLIKKYEDIDVYNLESNLPMEVLEDGGALIKFSNEKVDPKVKQLIALRSEILENVRSEFKGSSNQKQTLKT